MWKRADWVSTVEPEVTFSLSDTPPLKQNKCPYELLKQESVGTGINIVIFFKKHMDSLVNSLEWQFK